MGVLLNPKEKFGVIIGISWEKSGNVKCPWDASI